MKQKKQKTTEAIKIPEGVKVSVQEGTVSAKGKAGEISKKLNSPIVNVEVKDNEIIISSPNSSRTVKRMMGTYKAHIANIVKGANEAYVYKLKICSGHFPMNVALNKGELIIKNFIGEKNPRTLKIKEGAELKIDGDFIIVSSADKELAGQVASDIENLTRRPGFDTRIFQDGIFIIEKAGKEIK